MKIGVIGTGRLGICFSLILSKYLEEVNVYDKNLEYLKLIDEKQFNSPEPYVNELINEIDQLLDKLEKSNPELEGIIDLIYKTQNYLL